MMQLEDQPAAPDQLLVVRATVVTQAAEKSLIPATTGFNITHANQRLGTHTHLLATSRPPQARTGFSGTMAKPLRASTPERTRIRQVTFQNGPPETASPPGFTPGSQNLMIEYLEMKVTWPLGCSNSTNSAAQVGLPNSWIRLVPLMSTLR